MPPQTQTKKKSHKSGNNKAKCERYRASGRRTKAKLRRIRRSNGEQAALAYRDAMNIMALGKGTGVETMIRTAQRYGVPPRGALRMLA